jgi:hypothetical protein
VLDNTGILIEGERPMKKIFYFSLLIAILMFSFSACTLHVPYDWGFEASPYRIVLKVNPDDAQVLLNGKLVGYAYEFSTFDSAIRLASRNNELLIKREGYVEEEINLHNYSSHRITIRLNLLKDRDYRGPIKDTSDRSPKPPKPPKPPEKPAEKKPVKKPQPMPEATEFEQDSVKPVDVKLEIAPVESAIYLDGRFWGLAPKSGVIENLRLKPGKYVLSVVKPGYKDYKKIIYVTDVKVDLSIKLEKK